jgi:hypothetical protein
MILFPKDRSTARGNHQGDGDLGRRQGFERADRDGSATRTGNADDDGGFLGRLSCRSLKKGGVGRV